MQKKIYLIKNNRCTVLNKANEWTDINEKGVAVNALEFDSRESALDYLVNSTELNYAEPLLTDAEVDELAWDEAYIYKGWQILSYHV